VITATVEPTTRTGFRQRRYVLRVHNGGDVAVAVDLAVEDPDRLLEVSVSPSTLEVAPAASATARIRARVIPGWPIGDDPVRRFRAIVRAPDHGPVTAEAFMRLRSLPDRPLLAAGICGALVAVALAAAALGGGRGKQLATSVAASGRTVPTTAGATTVPVNTTAGAAPAATTGASPATTTGASAPATSTPTTAAAASGPAAAIALGAMCRPSSDLRVDGRTLTTGDGRFVRRFADDSATLAARNLLARKATFCTIGNAAGDDAELAFLPPPVEPTPAVPASRCTARYVPERLVKSRSQDGFVVEMAPGQYLFYAAEVDRDRAFALLQGYTQICWLGGGAEDIFSSFFDWSTALTYF
jgi:hypothetical protein